MADKTDNNEQSEGSLPAKSTPKDALVMAAILKEMGISEYEPRVINQMLEYTYRYITTVLEDAVVYSKHAGKKELDADDVQLAIQSRLDHSYTNPPPREFLIEIARQKNRHPLPQIQNKSGLRLPPDRYCLTSTNYKVKTQKKHSQVRANPVVARSISQSSVSTPIKATPTTIVTVKMPTTVPVTASTGVAAANVTVVPASRGVSGVTVKKEPIVITGAHTVQKAGVVTTVIPVKQVKIEPGTTAITSQPKTGVPATASQATVIPASMLTVSALPSMDETVASTQQPLITPLKRKHEDEDDDYDS
ncbi:Transcription initiation factor TFIID subunit 9B [Desmophyllum pertusum]|uniref:Transcription initiation factor TFIID subunit 9B n=1 Tax=Desmophyllum pertusum TaxID=174260 RepID=A0A9X0D9V0_9CNID|nr:Transcription initiation factor TFIID subunit 9B [Desmophyllum pertusum]